MSFTLKDIKGAVVEKDTPLDRPDGSPADAYLNGQKIGYNCGVDAQSSVPLRFNREKLAETLFAKWQDTKRDPWNSRWNQLSDVWKNPWYALADAINAVGKEIVEVDQ